VGIKIIFKKIFESLKAVLPISLIILALSFIIGVETRFIIGFVIGDILLVVGLAFFTLGSTESTVEIAENIGGYILKKRNLPVFILVAFAVGFMITVAEPALWVLADQFKSVVSAPILILAVAGGVGFFVVIGLLRLLTKIKLSTLFVVSYIALFIFAGIVSLVNPDFIPVAFDSGGVTTGPMAVPFIMSLGLGISKARGEKNAEENSFGLIGIASIGPILSVLILGFFVPASAPVSDTTTTLAEYFLQNTYQMAIAILPFVFFFTLFQILAFKMNKRRVIKVVIAFIYTYVGLVLFLTGANAGLVNIGTMIGEYFGTIEQKWIFVLLGVVFGFTVVAAEPSVIALNRQVEYVSAGTISRKFMMISLSSGVAIAIGLACLRVVTGISIWWILIPGYILAIVLTFFSPKIFSAIAFDSGGAVSGAMTSAFLMPYALGASAALGADILADAFGLVAFVAMAPLITIQITGLIYQAKTVKTRMPVDDNEIMELQEVGV